jgi:hypothetical protein
MVNNRASAWAALPAAGGFLLLAVFLLVLPYSCRGPVETLPPDSKVGPAPDAGGKNCDAEPNHWTVVDLGLSAPSDGGSEADNLFAVWGDSPTAVFAVGSQGRALFFDGKGWISQPTPTKQTLTSVWGTGPKDVWAVGFGGTVIHFDGSSWTEQSPPLDVFIVEALPDSGLPKGDAGALVRRDLWGVWAAGKNRTDALFAVGDRGIVLSRTGTAWSRVNTGVQDNLHGIWATSPGRLFIVGDFGRVLIGPSTGLSPSNTGVAKPLHKVWGRGDGDVYAIGLNGTILHYNGSGWTEVQGAPKQYLRGIWGPSNSSDLYLVGWDGTILRMYQGDEGPAFSPFNCITAMRLEGIWGTMVQPPPSDAGVVDGGNSLVPAIWISGVSGTIITGP